MTIVFSILNQMPTLRQPQRRFLENLFITILALRGHLTFRNLSRYAPYSERTFARQFRASFDWAHFHRLTSQPLLTPQDQWIVVQDASFISKSGKQTFGLGHFFNGCAGRVERGLEISVLALVNLTQCYALTLSVEQTPSGTKKAHHDASRLALYAEQVVKQRAHLPAQVKYLVVDGYYAKRYYLDAIITDDLHLITKLRCDADCSYLWTEPRRPGQRGASRKYAGKVDFQDLSRFTHLGRLEDEPAVELFTALVWHKSLKRKLRLAVLVKRQDPARPRHIVLASTDLELAAEELVKYYRARFQIEFLFRDAKQFTGLNDCQARDQKALNYHFNASLATLNLVRVEEIKARPATRSKVFSMASWKQRKFNERLVEMIIENLDLEPSLIKNHPRYEEIKTYGAIAA